jgi:hypothetical protein
MPAQATDRSAAAMILRVRFMTQDTG